ncbi:MAG TPA: lactonase family protein [Beijerinckiaceae bacterium]|nr:lactonase family protein [Beijerinckiaceae bacterium]
MSRGSTYVYVGNAGTRDVSAYAMNGDGTLTPIGTFAVSGPTAACFSLPLAVSPDNGFLFAALRNEPWSVRSFAIDAASGRLDDLGAGPLAANPCYLRVDKTGRFLLSASYFGSKIAVNRIGANGIVEPAHQVIETEPKSHAIVLDATNRHAISTSLGGEIVYQWRFDSEFGRLAPNEPPFVRVADYAGPRHFVFHPDGRRAYLLNEHVVTIHVYDYDPDRGTLSEKQVTTSWAPPLAAKMSAADIHVTPNGRFLYASERKSNTLALYAIDAHDGTLAFKDQIVTETYPRGFAIDPDGRFLYCAGQQSDRVCAYAIDPLSGKLSKIAAYVAGGGPNWIEIVRPR